MSTLKVLPRGMLIALAMLMLLGGWLRLAVVENTLVDMPLRGDAADYFMYGYNLQAHGVYSRSLEGLQTAPQADALRPPVMGIFVGLLMSEDALPPHPPHTQKLLGSIQPVLQAQALLSVLLIPLLFLAGSLLASPRVGLAVAFLTAIAPHLVNSNVYLLSESLFALWFTLGLVLLLCAGTDRAGRHTVLLMLAAGLAFGIASLTRPTTLYLPFILGAVFCALNPLHDRKPWLALMGMSLAIMIGWQQASTRLLGAPPPDSRLMINSIQHGMYPDFMHEDRPESRGMPYRFDTAFPPQGGSLTDVLGVLKTRALESPVKYASWYLLGKPLSLFRWQILPAGDAGSRILVDGDIYIYPTPISPYMYDPVFIGTYLLSYTLYRFLLLLAAAACVLAWMPAMRRHWGKGLVPIRILSLTLAYVIGVHMIAAPFPRYAIPFQPVIFLLAAGTVRVTWLWLRARQIERGAEVL